MSVRAKTLAEFVPLGDAAAAEPSLRYALRQLLPDERRVFLERLFERCPEVARAVWPSSHIDEPEGIRLV